MDDTIALLGIPWDSNSSHRFGCAEGPAAIRRALHSGSSNEATEHGLDIIARIEDMGDVTVANTVGSLDDAWADAERITQAVAEILGTGRRLVSVGGDHAVTFPILRAVADHHGPVSVLHVDAHPDLYDDFGGNPLSHASPFARSLEDGCIARLVQIGIRTATQHQRRQAERFDVRMIGARELDRLDVAELAGPIYVTIDLDGLDPSMAPGVSHHEPGGLTVREVLDVIDALAGRIIGADVVELNPSRDLLDMTAMVAAKLVKELAGAMVSGRPG